MDTSKEESYQMEPEIQALQDEASGTVDVDDEDEIEELHNSLKEVVKDPSVKPKLQCLMVDPSFSMVTVQSEDSGIVWETASSRCSTPWASEGSSPSESYSLESSGAQGKITVIMDEDKIIRKRKKSGRSKLGERFKRPSTRTAAYGTERPAMAEVSIPNVRPENEEPAELKVDKDLELFSLISEGYEILNIVVPSKLPTVDEEEASDLVDNLSYLQNTPKIKSKRLKPAPASTEEDHQGIIKVQKIVNGEKEHTDKDQEPLLKHAKKEGPDEDYLDKFKLVDPHAAIELPSAPETSEDENIIQEPEEVAPQEESKGKPSPSNIEDNFVIITDEEIASEHMDEVFYVNTGSMAEETHKGDDRDGGLTDEPKSLKESGSALFGSQETILVPVYLPEGPPKIIDPVLLEEPRAMSFLYTDLYDEAMGSRKRGDDFSDVESIMSEKSYKKVFSDDDDDNEGYLEKFILKDETEAVEDPPAIPDDTVEGERIIWPQTKFELTGCLRRVQEADESGGEKTAIVATEEIKESENLQPADTEKQEEVSQDSVTEIGAGSTTEQEEAGDSEVCSGNHCEPREAVDSKACAGNHCEPCDAGMVIPESSESVPQKDVSSLLLEERTEGVGEIRMDEMAEPSKEKEVREISAVLLEKSSDLLNDVEQAVSEVIKDATQETETLQNVNIIISEPTDQTIIEQPSLEKVKEENESHSDIKISEEPVNQTEAKGSDELVAEQASDITGKVEVKEATISETTPVVHSSESDFVVTSETDIIVTAPEATETSEISVVPVEPPKESAAIVEAEMPSAEPPDVEFVTVQDKVVTVEEVTTEDQKEGESVEKPGEVPVDEKIISTEETVKDDHLRSDLKDTINATDSQLSVEGPQGEIQDAIQEPAVHLVTQGELKVSEDAVEHDSGTVEISEVAELQPEKSTVSQTDIEVTSRGAEPQQVEESQQATGTELVEKVQLSTEEIIEVDKTKDTAEKSEQAGEITSMLQENTDISDIHKPEEVEHKQSTASEKNQAVTVALFPGKVETIEFSIGQRGSTDTAEVNKHVAAQKKTKKEARPPIIEVVLSKAPLAPGIATEKQLPTSKPEISPVDSRHKDCEGTVTTGDDIVTSVQKDTKEDVSLDSIPPQTEIESNKKALEESVQTAEAEKAAELEKVEPEVRETQALDKPITEVDFMPGDIKEEIKVPAESDDGVQKAVSLEGEGTVPLGESELIKPDIPVSEEIVSDVVAEIPSEVTQAPEAEVITEEIQGSDKPASDTAAEVLPEENKVSEQIIASVVAEIPAAETQAPEGVIAEYKISNLVTADTVSGCQIPEVTNEDKVSVKMVEGVAADIPAAATAEEVLIEESKVSDKTSCASVVAEIPAAITEVITEEKQGSDKLVSDLVAEIPSAETLDEILPEENKVSEQNLASVVAEIPAAETIIPEVITEENQDSNKLVSDVAAEIPLAETQSPEAVSAETKLSEEAVSDVVAETPLDTTLSAEAITVEYKTESDTVSEIPSVETLNDALTADNKLTDKIDVVADCPSVETVGPEVVIEAPKILDQTENLKPDAAEEQAVTETLFDKISATIVETEMPPVEKPGVDVVTVKDTAVRTPSPSAVPVKAEEVTTEDQKGESQEEEPEDLVLSPLRSFSPQEDLSALSESGPLKGPDYYDETAEEFGYEVVTQQEVSEYVDVKTEAIPEGEVEDERLLEEETSKALKQEEEAIEDVLEADYEFIEESESIVLSEEDQAKMQVLDAFCLVCQCPVLMMEEHRNHEMCSLDKACEVLKDRLGSLISTLQERSENIEDMVSEIELAYNSVEEHCKSKEQTMDDQNEEMLKLVMDQYNEMSHTMEEEKKAKLEKLYDQIVSFQESIDSAKETLEKHSKQAEEEENPHTFVSSSEEIKTSLAKALECNTLELGPRGLSVFDDYGKGSGNGQKHRKGIPVPQKPHLQPQEANSATSTSVTVYWRVNEGDIIDCFQVYCMEDPQGAISEEYRVTVKESYCTLEELDPDKSYKVWVMAVNYTGCSLPSERLSFKTAPSVPVIHPEQCTVLWDSATLRWTSEELSSAESFTLEYCRQYACEGEGLRSVSGIRGCEQRVLLQPNENYLFYIKAVNSAGASEQSEAALVSTRGTRFHLLRETAGPALRLSEDKNTVLYPQDSFNEMASINECPAILGELLPLKGCYYWETAVSGCPSYRLGITYSSTPTDSLVGENSTSWCMHCVPTANSSRFELLHNSVETDIFVVDVPTRVGTLLDFTQGRLVFFNAQNGHLLGSTQHRFTEACQPAFGLESPGCLTIHMLPEVPEFARHC